MNVSKDKEMGKTRFPHLFFVMVRIIYQGTNVPAL
jgi:hypothetical protein